MNRTFKPNRQGITLLFVISMIVLFLLMGTAFVIVANNFNRESNGRIRANAPEDKGSQLSNQLIDEAILQLIRGTDLRDTDSPLKANDMLSDQYGFGFKTRVSIEDVPPRMVGDEAFVEIAFRANPDVAATEGQAFDLLERSTTAEELTPDVGNDGTADLIDNLYGGQVLSFTTGPARGFSARIYSDYFDADGFHIFRIPASSISGDIITDTTITDPSFDGSEVIINGRDFSGTGAAVTLDALNKPSVLGMQAQLPNRVGQMHGMLVGLSGNADAYLSQTDSDGMTEPNVASVNEPWDAADISTMFLSGYDKFGNIIPSFHRQALIENGPASTLSGRTFFHAFDITDPDDLTNNMAGMPDVDTDGDGTKDSFWMDLGLSIITNREGRRFKPLFAIHIKDMDGRLSVNAHGNRTHEQTNGFVAAPTQTWAGGSTAPLNSPLGWGMGVAEINLVPTIGDTARLTTLLDSRYDGFPGDETSFRSQAKLFGYPRDIINPTGEDGFGTIGGLFSTAMDINGRFQIGSPNSAISPFDTFVDLNYGNFNNGLPQINMLTTEEIPGFSGEFIGNAYEMSLSGLTSSDRPFTPEEFERILRPDDIDSKLLPDRLFRILGDTGRDLLTTHSFDVPMLYKNFTVEILQSLSQRGTALDIDGINLLTNIDGQFAFAPELFRGLKMDINRPFGNGIDDNDNGVVDEPGETPVRNVDASGVLGRDNNMDLTYANVRPNSAADDADPRVIFARHLYMLAMLKLAPVDLFQDGPPSFDDPMYDPTMDPERLAFAEAMAQWAVNVVDFRDPDSIHTRFVYDPFPFDAQGWNPTTDAEGNDLPVAQISDVWGAERPELLLTETLAVHIQNMEMDDSGTYVQRLRPEPFAYFEVYNPWTQNRLNQHIDGSLYRRLGVDLTRKAPDDSPVWRFAVERADESDPTKFTPLRYVYMTDPTDSPITYDNAMKNQVAKNIEVFFSSGRLSLVRPGRQAVIGTRGFEVDDKFQVFMGRKTNANDTTENEDDLKLDQTTRLAVTPGNGPNPGTIERYTGVAEMDMPAELDSSRQATIVFIDQATTGAAPDTAKDRKFSLSDRFGGYPDMSSLPRVPSREIADGLIYTTPTSTLDTADRGRTQNEIDTMIRVQDGISKTFRYIRLQRLANPLIPWNAVTNPYLTIDSMEADLVSINGADMQDSSLETPVGGTQAVSHERGDATDPVRARTQLWGYQRSAEIRPGTAADSTDHHYALAFTESLGRTNDSFAPTTVGLPFPWLTWNNRPFISHMEIMNVPYLAPEELTYAPELGVDPSRRTQPFTIDDETVRDPYGTSGDTADPDADATMATRTGALAGRYGHLLNFFAGEINNAMDSNSDMPGPHAVLDAYQLLDFIEVPSRFVNNESYYIGGGARVLLHPFNTISHYRAPGLVNVNTIPPSNEDSTASTVWDALIAEQVTWGDFKDSLYGDADKETGPSGPTNFENPFRPTVAANLVPGVTDKLVGSACTLLRSGDMAGMPLFDYTSGSPADNSNRSAAFRNLNRTRLGNMVTTKSSVFACWITVGYFEVDEDGNLLDRMDPNTPLVPANNIDQDMLEVSPDQVAEIGADTGEQVRNRAFFIFDRSIPVAFEPGKNHNVEKAILIKSIIE